MGNSGKLSSLRCGTALSAAVLVLMGAQAHAGDDSALKTDTKDKTQYTLFRPTPDSLLRDFSTDRPDATESPFTVDAGRFQFETQLFGFARSRADAAGVFTESYEIGTTNIRIGLTHNSEFNFIWQPYGAVRTRDPSGPVPRQSGVGGVDLRAKINIWGNDNFERPGSTALALLPYVSLPTDRNNGISPEHVEAGLIVPFAIVLTDKFGLGLNAGVSAVRNETGIGTHAEWSTSASLSYAWSDKLGTYYEVGARFGLDGGLGDIVFVGTGVTYKLSKNMQLDAGINVGLTDAADRVNPFVGISMRY